MKKQRLDFRTLNHILAYDNRRTRIKSVIVPSAQYATLLQKRVAADATFSETVAKVLQNENVSVFVRAVIELQFLYGLRISECLNISVQDVSQSGAIRVKGSKKSNDRIVYPVLFQPFWQSATSSTLPLINLYSRFYFYRQYKALGLYAQYAGNSNLSVTHSFRHNLLLNLKKEFQDTSLNKQFVGHKSINSTLHYENKKRV